MSVITDNTYNAIIPIYTEDDWSYSVSPVPRMLQPSSSIFSAAVLEYDNLELWFNGLAVYCHRFSRIYNPSRYSVTFDFYEPLYPNAIQLVWVGGRVPEVHGTTLIKSYCPRRPTSDSDYVPIYLMPVENFGAP